jgi:anaerobic magnesium-protoporphyrin IX monomethyl ester cyclase
LKTLFINPNNRNPMGDLAAIEPPLWLLLMAAHYMEDRSDVKILDAEAQDLTVEQTVDAVLARNPDEVIIVVMGNNPSVSSTPKMAVAEEIEATLRPHFNKLYLTGLHPMAVGGPHVLSWHPTKTLPLPFKLLDMSLYRAHNWHCLDGSPRKPYASIYTSLGCPFNCHYCNIHTLYHNQEMKYRNPGNTILEVNDLVMNYGVKNIKIWDELFALSASRVIPLMQMLRNYELNIWAYARVDTVTEPMLKAMKEGGVNWLAYGFESGDILVREKSAKMFSDSKVERAIKMTREAGINIIGNFMFGLPGETIESAKVTVAWAKEHLFEFVNFYEALPYPGSKWYEETKPTMNTDEYDQYKRPKGLWSNFRAKAFRDYFTNPAYIGHVIDKFGESGGEMIRSMMIQSNKVGVK